MKVQYVGMVVVSFIVASLIFIFIQQDDDDIIMDAFLSQPNPTVNHIAPKIEVTVAMVEQQQEKEKERGNIPPANQLSGTTGEEKIWNFFASKGLSSVSIAGILGNLNAESNGYNPFLQEGNKHRTYEEIMALGSTYNNAFGLIQWDGVNRTSVVKAMVEAHPETKSYLSATSIPEDIIATAFAFQLEYMYTDLQNFKDVYWNCKTRKKGNAANGTRRPVLELLAGATSVGGFDGTARIYHDCVVRSNDAFTKVSDVNYIGRNDGTPGGHGVHGRAKYAAQVLDKYTSQ